MFQNRAFIREGPSFIRCQSLEYDWTGCQSNCGAKSAQKKEKKHAWKTEQKVPSPEIIIQLLK